MKLQIDINTRTFVRFWLVVIGFGIGNEADTTPASWHLSFYSLIAIFIIVMGNGGFRTQEARLLTWGDIKRIYGKGEETYAEVVVRAETTKVRKTRTFEMRRGDVFHRRHEKTQYKEPKDFVFQMYQTKEVVNATKLGIPPI